MAEALPQSLAANNAANQVIRSSSSAASNYRAAQRARSRKEFISKIGIAVEEGDETLFWLEYIEGLGVVPSRRLKEVRTEADELVRILVSIRKNSKG